ncbi:MAG: Qat anti-phage system TatD family nuclease QatD [Janthinobacterium lividum]
MTSPLVDFHCHLDLYPDFADLVRECEKRRVLTLAVTTTPQAWTRNRELASATKYVRAALGFHPQLVGERWREIDLWLRILPETRYVGEVGLDAGPAHFRTLDRQKEVFRTVLQACAAAGDKVLSVHSLRAVKPTLDMLEEHLPLGRGKVVLHWFTGTQAEARRAVGLGCHFSVNAPMLRNERGCKLVFGLPPERLLTETDGPFTEEAGRPCRPWDVATTLGLLQHQIPSGLVAADLVASNLKALLAPGVIGR